MQYTPFLLVYSWSEMYIAFPALKVLPLIVLLMHNSASLDKMEKVHHIFSSPQYSFTIADPTFQYNTTYYQGGGLAILFGLAGPSEYFCCGAEVKITESVNKVIYCSSSAGLPTRLLFDSPPSTLRTFPTLSAPSEDPTQWLPSPQRPSIP